MIITAAKKTKLTRLAIALATLFVLLTLIVFFAQDFITNKIDAPIQSLFWQDKISRFPDLEPLMMQITKFGSFNYQIIIALLFILFLAIFRRINDIFYLIFSYGIFSLIALVGFKPLIARSRPVLQDFFANRTNFITENGFSFPSGHSTSSILLYGSIIIILFNWIKNKTAKYLITILLSVLIIIIGISRVYLGVHYPTDVIGGFLLGAFGLTVMSLLAYRNVTEKLQNK